MFKVQLTTTDHATGKTRTITLPKVYKTRQWAEKAARSFEYTCKPDGKTVTTSCDAVIVEVSND